MALDSSAAAIPRLRQVLHQAVIGDLHVSGRVIGSVHIFPQISALLRFPFSAFRFHWETVILEISQRVGKYGGRLEFLLRGQVGIVACKVVPEHADDRQGQDGADAQMDRVGKKLPEIEIVKDLNDPMADEKGEHEPEGSQPRLSQYMFQNKRHMRIVTGTTRRILMGTFVIQKAMALPAASEGRNL